VTGTVLDKASRWFVAGVLLASLAGLVAGALGTYSPALDVLANARVHLAGLTVAAGLALWINHRPVVVLALGAFLTLAAHSILAGQSEGPLLAALDGLPTQGPGLWTIVSLNTWHAHADAAGLADQLAATNADVLVLTEFGPNKIETLHALAKSFPYRIDCARQWDCAIAILSKHPFTSSGSSPEGLGPATAWLTFGAGQQAMTVLGVHVAEPMRSPATHARELSRLASMTLGISGSILVAGDFNTTPWTAAFAHFSEVSGLRHMGRFLPSYPSGLSGMPQLAVDHMFASPAVRFEDVWLGPDIGSDHRPVLASIRLPETLISALP